MPIERNIIKFFNRSLMKPDGRLFIASQKMYPNPKVNLFSKK